MSRTSCITNTGGPTDIDVLLGRGKKLLGHAGNISFRDIVDKNKVGYASCVKSDKLKISKSIVRAIYCTGGRFLKMDDETKMWVDVGEKKAIEKTSQALREGAPTLKKKLGIYDQEKRVQPREETDDANKTDILIDSCFQVPAPVQSKSTQNNGNDNFEIMDDVEIHEDHYIRHLPPSPRSSLDSMGYRNAILEVSREMFDHPNSVSSSFRDDIVIRRSFVETTTEETDDDLMETNSLSGRSRRISLVGRMSGIADNLAFSQTKLLLKGMSGLSNTLDCSKKIHSKVAERVNDALSRMSWCSQGPSPNFMVSRKIFDQVRTSFTIEDEAVDGISWMANQRGDDEDSLESESDSMPCRLSLISVMSGLTNVSEADHTTDLASAC